MAKLNLSDHEKGLAVELLEEMRRDPVLACKLMFGEVPDFWGELAPHQRIHLRGMWEKPWVMAIWGRGTGKSFMDALYVALRAVLFPNEKIIIIGPGFRQAQIVFKYIEEKCVPSPVFVDAIIGGTKGIKHNTSEWSIEFKNGSWIKAIPLGADGSKIRGYRANRLIIDEFVQVPREIIDAVAVPFMATKKNPLAKYLNLDTEDSGNTLILSSSAYYTFNHGYQRYCDYLHEIYAKQNPKYLVTVFNYEDVPEGFIDTDVLEMARRTSTSAMFRTEWGGEWVSDTEGFYPASLIETVGSPSCKIELRGEEGAKYVLGVDPASIYNTCGFTVIKLGDPNKVVYCESVGPIKYTEICSRIMDFRSKYNIVRIGMDSGAGIPIMNLFEEGRTFVDGGVTKLVKLLATDDDSGREGERIIQLMGTSSQAVNEVNYSMKAAMEAGTIQWPIITGEVSELVLEETERAMEQIRELQTEFRTVEALPTASGLLKFRVPEHRNKDRYSSALFANFAAKALASEITPPQIVLPSGFWGPGVLH